MESSHPIKCKCISCVRYVSNSGFREDFCLECNKETLFVRHKRYEYYYQKIKIVCYEICMSCSRIVVKHVATEIDKTYFECNCSFCQSKMFFQRNTTCVRCYQYTSKEKFQYVDVCDGFVLFRCGWRCDKCFKMKLKSEKLIRASQRGHYVRP